MTILDRRRFALGTAAAAAGAPIIGSLAHGETEEISHASAAIHQEVVFAAPADRVYRALIDASEFDKVSAASAAMTSAMRNRLGAAPTQIDARPGGGFLLFGGYISGRIIELVANTRIVQAWRTATWDAGAYSIAKFVLSEAGAGTRLKFDHTGFPSDAVEHLAKGWHENYWQPLAKILAS